jgi:hypothetical protein
MEKLQKMALTGGDWQWYNKKGIERNRNLTKK